MTDAKQTVAGTQYIRKASLILSEGNKVLDLSEMHFKFQTQQEDQESPSNCSIRVFNLSEDTAKAVKAEYGRVILQAGYESAYGVIFDGTIKQFRFGREPDGISTYLDILAADGDVPYNYAVMNQSLAAGSTIEQRIALATGAMGELGLQVGHVEVSEGLRGIANPRGAVLFGLARTRLRSLVRNAGATWTIQDGKIYIVPLDGFLPGEAVLLNHQTGLIGRVEQTNNGMTARCLLNPKITVGGLVKIDEASINQTIQRGGGTLLAYDKRAPVMFLASTQGDGLYRVYVATYTGDTRGQDWYTDITCLSVDPNLQEVKPYG